MNIDALPCTKNETVTIPRHLRSKSLIGLLLLYSFLPGHGLVSIRPPSDNSLAWRRCFPMSRTTATSSVTLFCQLLGMNCAVESEISLTWHDFCERGGSTDIHADGWGLAYYAGNTSQGLRQFHDVEAASTSALAQFLGQQSIRTRNLLAHIRYATSGSVDLANVHPFARECVLECCFGLCR
jgi:Glutamine amidotransferases class-II